MILDLFYFGRRLKRQKNRSNLYVISFLIYVFILFRPKRAGQHIWKELVFRGLCGLCLLWSVWPLLTGGLCAPCETYHEERDYVLVCPAAVVIRLYRSYTLREAVTTSWYY